MDEPIKELLQKYAKLGWKHWNKQPNDEKQRASKQIGVEIAACEWSAMNAATVPFRPGKSMLLVPMPCKPKNKPTSFFVPWTDGEFNTDLSFDLVILLDQSPHPFAFRFEPAEQGISSTHGYNHVQLSKSLGKREVPVDNVQTYLPTTYPAFPIPSKDPIHRFLSMAVAMHGFPYGFNDILGDAFQGDRSKFRKYRNMTKEMLRE